MRPGSGSGRPANGLAAILAMVAASFVCVALSLSLKALLNNDVLVQDLILLLKSCWENKKEEADYRSMPRRLAMERPQAQ